MRRPKYIVTAAIAVSLAACLPSPLLPSANAAFVEQSSSWEGEVRAGLWPSFTTLLLPEPGNSSGGTLRLFGRTYPLEQVTITGDDIVARSTTVAEPHIRVEARFMGQSLVGKITQDELTLPFTFWRVPSYPPATDRIAGWRQDIDALRRRFSRADRSFTPKERKEFQQALNRLEDRLPRFDDAQISVGMAKAISLAKNGHTRLYLARNRTRLRHLPIRVWFFSDGFRIVRATKSHQTLVGCRIDRIGDLPIAQVETLIDRMQAGAPSWLKYMATYAVTSPDALHGAGVPNSRDRVTFRLSQCAAEGETTLVPLPLVKSDSPVEAWWDLSPVFRAPDSEWVHALDGRSSELPLHLQNSANYSSQFVQEQSLLYFQFNRAENQPSLSLQAFGEQLIERIRNERPRIFVLDLRYNTGGNLELSEGLMGKLLELTSGMQRYVVIGRATFSAGITAAATWRSASDVLMVGEPVGDDLEFWAEGGNIRLPYSGYDAHFANALHSYSTAPCPQLIACLDKSVTALGPDLRASSSWSDYIAGRDPALEAILAAARKRSARANLKTQ